MSSNPPKKTDVYGLASSRQFRYLIHSFVFTFLVVVLNRFGPERLFFIALASFVVKARTFIVLVNRRRRIVKAALLKIALPASLATPSRAGVAAECAVYVVMGLALGALSVEQFIASVAAEREKDGGFWPMLLAAYALSDAACVLRVAYAAVRFEARDIADHVRKVQALPAGSLVAIRTADIDIEAQAGGCDTAPAQGDAKLPSAAQPVAAALPAPLVAEAAATEKAPHDS